MIKNVMAFLASMLFFVSISGEKTCTDIWTMDNNINGISLYKVSLHMCTEGIMAPTFTKQKDPLILTDNLTHTLNITNFTHIKNLTSFKNTSEIIIPNITTSLKNKTNVNISYITPSPASYIEPSSSITPSSSLYPSPLLYPTPSPLQGTSPSSSTIFSPEPTNEINNLNDDTKIIKNNTKNNTKNKNDMQNNESLYSQNKQLEPVHIVLLSVGCTILGFAIILIVYIVVKQQHCKNKVNQEEKKSTLYKKKPDPQNKQTNEPNKNNIKLTVNAHKEKLKALERFKSTQKKPERKRFKGAAKKVININRVSRHLEPKYPPGMDAEKKQAPNTPPPPPIAAQQQLIKQKTKQKTNQGDDLV